MAHNPLAWIVVEDEVGPFATAVPVRPIEADGSLSSLVGHIPRSSRMANCLTEPCHALIITLGPQGYISPSWMSDRSQAPTWNYTCAQFTVELRLRDEPVLLDDHLRDLSRAMEQGRENAWSVDEMGERLAQLSSRIVAIEATVIRAHSRFKLGQDESDVTYSEVVENLAIDGNSELVTWMRRYNKNRS